MPISFSSLKWRQMVLSLAAVLALLAAVPVRADVVPTTEDEVDGDNPNQIVMLQGNKGSQHVTFGTEALEGKRFNFSRTYKLANPDAVFTAFVLDPQSITMSLSSIVGNQGVNSPFVDTSAIYGGTMSWSGSISLTSAQPWTGTDSEQYAPNQRVNGIDYIADALEEGVPSTTYSNYVNAEFDPFDSFIYTANDLAGISEITFTFELSGIDFVSDIETAEWWGADMLAGWSGTVDGAFLVEWGAAGNITPEPASVLIWGFGLAGAALVVARRKRK